MKPVTVQPLNLVLLVTVASAGAFAVGRFSAPSNGAALPADSAKESNEAPAMAAHGLEPSSDPGALPPGHPAVGSQGPAAMMPAAPTEADGPDLAWTRPARWQERPSPSSFRLATYAVPHAPSDTEDGDVAVSRAGGGVGANVERWLGQFDDAGKKSAKQEKLVVGGFPATILSAEGRYSGAMGGEPKDDWAFIGVVIEAPGLSYFVKLAGPKATVRSARKELDGMLATVHPAGERAL